VEEVKEQILNFKFEILNLRPRAIHGPDEMAAEAPDKVLNFKFKISNSKSTH
jgi:hypothetical protein